MAFNLTDQQLSAIKASGNVLVSAAAGSGKTAVLVERVIRLLTDEASPIEADRLLIVTFTNAAAAEMRTRIEKRLDDECRKNPQSIALLKQRRMLASAKICTIDSFCIDLVRENFEKIGVSPDFKIAEQNALKPIDEYIVGNLLNEYFEEKNPVFGQLLDIVGAEFDDGNFQKFLLDIYNYSRQTAFPEKWFDELSVTYNPELFDRNNKWYAAALDIAKNTISELRSKTSVVLDMLYSDEKAKDKYADCIEICNDIINGLYDTVLEGDWDSIFDALENLTFPPIERAFGTIGKAAKLVYSSYIEETEHLKRIFYADSAEIKNQLSEIYPAVSLLSEILKKLECKLFEEYTERNTYTFHNIEHLAFKLLCRENGEPTETATELSKHYYEVMVDEYQDTNDLQDKLFHVLSGLSKKLFAVGDVKQSIYGFRGAEPQNFLNKLENTKKTNAERIILGNNFRSREEICEYINFFFEKLMTAKTGRLSYDENEKLYPKAEYPKAAINPVSFHIAEYKANSEERIRAEAVKIAEYIKEVMSSGETIRKDEKTLRKAEFSDFTILLRNTKNKAPILAEELRKNGIPVNYSVEGYAESAEISVFLSLLKVIDNPDSDIELLTVLMSPIFGFSAEELANMRAAKKTGSLYSALIFAAENGHEHSAGVLRSFETMRIKGATLTLPRLISTLLSETDYLNTVSALGEGERRRANLLLLINYAEQYSSENTGGIGGFVNYIIKQSENGIRSASSFTSGGSVKIMSIHASKGLQFPICIVAGTDNDFSNETAKKDTLYSLEFGIGFRYFDENISKKKTTLAREIIKHSIDNRETEEELRLLYVAMTRAEDILHFSAVTRDFSKLLTDTGLSLVLADGKPDNMFSNMNSYLKWLAATLLIHPNGENFVPEGYNMPSAKTESKIETKVSTFIKEDIIETDDEEVYIADKALAEEIKKNIAYKYPFSELINIEAKASVSALANKAESKKYAFSGKPSFMSDGGITAAEKGTATHKIIEFIDFEKAGDLEAEIERLYEWQFISEREAKAVNKEKLKEFFESELFRRIKNASLVKREMRFLTEVSASRIDPNLRDELKDEKIIVQGAVDLCFVEDGEVVIVDFKTDRAETPESLIEAYGEQLSLYALAAEKIFERRVKQRLIYSFYQSKEIEIKN